MKIVTYLLGALLAAALGAAALFYFQTFRPMQLEYAKMKPAMPELDKARAELKKYKAKETQATGWVPTVLADISKQLDEQIKAGTAEATATDDGLVINISEKILYTDRSVTFHKDSRPLLAQLAAALSNKELNGKEIMVANLTEAAPAQGKGKKRIPPKDARTLAADRSLALTKYLEQNKVEAGLVAAGYGAKLPESGFKIKDHKTMIIITNPPSPAAAAAPAAAPKAAPAPAPKSGGAKPATPSTGAPQQQPKPIPVQPAAPKGQ